MRGGLVFAVLRSATTAPWPPSGRVTVGALGGSLVGGSGGMTHSIELAFAGWQGTMLWRSAPSQAVKRATAGRPVSPPGNVAVTCCVHPRGRTVLTRLGTHAKNLRLATTANSQDTIGGRLTCRLAQSSGSTMPRASVSLNPTVAGRTSLRIF